MELEHRSSSQKASPWSGEYVGAHFRLARALARALRAKIGIAPQKKSKNRHFLLHVFWRAARAQVRARSQNARQCVLLITKMIFDYLIAILAQKAEILEKVENWPIFKNSSKSAFFGQIFDFFTKFQLFLEFRLFELE